MTRGVAGDPRLVVEELAALFEHYDPEPGELLAEAILGARRVLPAGQGRSGLVAAAFAVRLGHLGVETHLVGDVTAPAVGPGDLVVALSRSGHTAITLHQAQRAAAAGARVAAVGADAGSPLLRAADVPVVLPLAAVRSAQHAGSLFEQAALVVLDALCARLQATLGRTDAELAARHDNLQ